MGGITLKKDVPTFSTSVGSYKYFFNPCVGFAIGDGDGKVHSVRFYRFLLSRTLFRLINIMTQYFFVTISLECL